MTTCQHASTVAMCQEGQSSNSANNLRKAGEVSTPASLRSLGCRPNQRFGCHPLPVRGRGRSPHATVYTGQYRYKKNSPSSKNGVRGLSPDAEKGKITVCLEGQLEVGAKRCGSVFNVVGISHSQATHGSKGCSDGVAVPESAEGGSVVGLGETPYAALRWGRVQGVANLGRGLAALGGVRRLSLRGLLLLCKRLYARLSYKPEQLVKVATWPKEGT